MRKYFAIPALLLLMLSCTTIKHRSEVVDVHTGVMYGGREIVVMDRNIGAESYGDNGAYLTWKQARIVCPEGYHLMTYREARLISEKRKYYPYEKLVNGDLKVPLAGYIPFNGRNSRLEYKNIIGYYHIDEMFEGKPMGRKINSIFTSTNGSFHIISNLRNRMSVRCVRDY